MVATSVVCADTAAEAERLASSSRMTFLRLRQGRPIAVPPVEKALAWFAGRDAAAATAGAGRRMIVGAPDTVRARLLDVAQEYGADEVMVVTITHDHGARRRSYELIAEAFGVARRRSPTAPAAEAP
jgi:alkanesulfonate monooxygenase SsuD/methylene tetrahydromethanopterin reductase-like flavin-dependent oxidoreductase (luciferase family)